MFPAQKKTSGHKISAVFDIESGSVGAAILCSHPDATAEILEATRSTLPFEDRDKRATAVGVMSLLTTVAEKLLADYALQEKHTEPIEGVYAIIRAPWSNSRTLHVTKTFESDTVVTEALITELAQQALTSGTDHKDESGEVFETTVMRVELNGYPTAKPLGKTAREVTVWVLASDCNDQIHKGIGDIFAKFFPGQTPVLRSGVRAALSVLQETRAEYPDYVIVDMASMGSNIVSVINGVAVAHELVPEGVYAILARISANRLPEESLSTLRMMGRDQGTDEMTDAMNMAMSVAEPEMAKVFGDSMSALSVRHRLPNQMFLFTQAEIAGWLSKFFTRIDFAQFTQTTRPFLVEALSRDSFTQQVSSDAKLSTDVGLSVACALVHMEQ